MIMKILHTWMKVAVIGLIFTSGIAYGNSYVPFCTNDRCYIVNGSESTMNFQMTAAFQEKPLSVKIKWEDLEMNRNYTIKQRIILWGIVIIVAGGAIGITILMPLSQLYYDNMAQVVGKVSGQDPNLEKAMMMAAITITCSCTNCIQLFD